MQFSNIAVNLPRIRYCPKARFFDIMYFSFLGKIKLMISMAEKKAMTERRYRCVRPVQGIRHRQAAMATMRLRVVPCKAYSAESNPKTWVTKNGMIFSNNALIEMIVRMVEGLLLNRKSKESNEKVLPIFHVRHMRSCRSV